MTHVLRYLLPLTLFSFIYISFSYYLYRGLHWFIPHHSAAGRWVLTVFVLLSLAFIAGRIAERWMPLLPDWLIQIGSIWMVFQFYGFWCILIIDLCRWLLPVQALSDPARVVIGIGVLLCISMLTFLGYRNAHYFQVTSYQVALPASQAIKREWRIVMASDLHIGTLNDSVVTAKMVSAINAQKPDIILLAGDLADGDLTPIIANESDKELLKLSAPHGVWACTGNHEFIGGGEAVIRHIAKYNVRFLRDEWVTIGDSFVLAGREDRIKYAFTGIHRKPLAQILETKPSGLPVVLMDHTPSKVQEAVNAGVGLQLSGHTHKGQIWPFEWFVRPTVDLLYGYRKFKTLQLIVSSGLGTWGPPVRIGTRSEIVVITLSLY